MDKGIFTRELEIALRAGEIDAAVHSLKDVPTELDEGFAIAAVMPRAPVGGCVAVQVRRRNLRPSTRHPRGDQQCASCQATALVAGQTWSWSISAATWQLESKSWRSRNLCTPPCWRGAGLMRLGLLSEAGGGMPHLRQWPELHVAILDPTKFLPAASQGAVGIEARDDVRNQVRQALAAINDAETMTCVTAEREFLHLLQAGCQTPVGLLSTVQSTDLRLSALVFKDDDKYKDGESEVAPKSATVVGDATDPRKVARALFEGLR